MGFIQDRLEKVRDTFPVPPFARLDRTLGLGMHPYLAVFPGVMDSPGMRRVAPTPQARERLLRDAKVHLSAMPGFAYINTREPCIELAWTYFEVGSHLDLYLDMLHELTHLRQLAEGADLWDRRFSYVDRVTEIEGYAVAVEEGRRLGMTPEMIRSHLHNPWMTQEDVVRLEQHIDVFLQKAGPLPP